MSYILQALQRAEAERNRGATPGLHTPTLPAATAAEPRRGRALPWGLGAAALAVAGALAWWLWPASSAPVPEAATQPPPTTAAAPAPAVPATPPVAQAVPPAAVITAPPEAMPAPAPRAEPAPRRAPVDVPPPRTPSGNAMPPAAMTPPPAGPATAVRPATQPAPTAPASPANTAPAQAPLPTLAELPPALRQSLPTLNLGGGIYSAEPANRLLIVNGQVLREKAQLAPELVLESIGPRAAVFRFRGQRFEMRY